MISRITAPMVAELTRNPGFLKLDLYCKGIQIHGSCQLGEDGGREILRTRAGLGSGLELILPNNLWVNVPVVEDFARESPYSLRKSNDCYLLFRNQDPLTPVRLAPKPRWYDEHTSSGKLMRSVGTLQGTYLGIYPARVCDFWRPTPTRPERANCHFCSVGLNLGADDADSKTVDDVMEVVHAAWRESRITYIDFNTGHYEGETYLDFLEPLVARIKKETPLFVGIQTPPHRDLSRYDRLKAMRVNRVSFCFELFDEARFREVCPGKAATYGLERYLEAIEYCAKLSKPGEFTLSPWVTNGEIIAGLEAPESSIAAINWMTERGAIPTVCVFRPLRGTDYENLPPPKTAELVPVFRRLYEACMEHGLPIGVAPNIHVSLVLLPEECRWFVEDARRFKAQERRLAFKAKAFALAYRLRETSMRAISWRSRARITKQHP